MSLCLPRYALITSPALTERLRELDGAGHYHIQQALLFFAAQTTGLNFDNWSLDTAPRGFAHTIWIPLQNGDFRSDVPSVIPRRPKRWRCSSRAPDDAIVLMPPS